MKLVQNFLNNKEIPETEINLLNHKLHLSFVQSHKTFMFNVIVLVFFFFLFCSSKFETHSSCIDFYFSLCVYVCVCMNAHVCVCTPELCVGVWAHVPWCTHGSQRDNLRGWSSPAPWFETGPLELPGPGF